MGRSALLASVLALPLIFFGSACSTPSASEEGRQQALSHFSQEDEAFLQSMGLELTLEDLKTTRREVVAQLGTPDEVFEDGRVVAYWLSLCLVGPDSNILRFDDVRLVRTSFSIDETRLKLTDNGDFGDFLLMAEFTGVSDGDALLRHAFINRSQEW
jgi:hypothetical protein